MIIGHNNRLVIQCCFFPEAFLGNVPDAGEILFQSSYHDIIHRILPVQDELTHSLAT